MSKSKMESIQVLLSFPSCKDESLVNLPEHYEEIIYRESVEKIDILCDVRLAAKSSTLLSFLGK